MVFHLLQFEHVLFSLMVAVILAPFSYYMGYVSKAVKLPQLTGYLIAGIICGPYVIGLMSREQVHELSWIEQACLSAIGLAAGAELERGQLGKSMRQVLGITLSVCVSSWIFCYAAFRMFDASFPLMPDMDAHHLVAVSTLGATLMMTRSPASAIAVLKEVDAKGPFSTLVMAVTVAKDVVVIVAFALNMEIVRTVILHVGPPGGKHSLLVVGMPVLFTAASMLLGACFGGILSILINLDFRKRMRGVSSMSQQTTERWRMALLLVSSATLFQVCDYFGAEPLLSCVSMGMVMVNRRSDKKDELHSMLSQILSMTNVAFFGLVGASLRLTVLQDLLGPSFVVSVVRAVSIMLGSYMGCRACGTSPEHRNIFWASMITQAGVAMGLARLAGSRFPAWGPHFQTFMTSIILINLFLGPPLFRWSLISAGEARAITKGGHHDTRAPGLQAGGSSTLVPGGSGKVVVAV